MEEVRQAQSGPSSSLQVEVSIKNIKSLRERATVKAGIDGRA